MMKIFRMFNPIKNWVFKRRRRAFEKWKLDVVKLIVEQVLPEDAPFQYDSVLSFLQVERFDPVKPLRLDLLFPDYPLAIDIVGPHQNPSYVIASRYVNQDEWEKLQEQLSIKKQLFASYGCHYMMLSFDEAIDARSITEKIKAVIGHYLE